MHSDIKLIQEAYDQQIHDMMATMAAPVDSVDSGSVPLSDGYYFLWNKNNKEFYNGVIYDRNDKEVTDDIDSFISGDKTPQTVGEHSLRNHLITTKLETFKTQAVTTIAHLEALPEKTIIWYPEHGTSFGTYTTRDALLVYLDSSAFEDTTKIKSWVMDKESRNALQQAAKLTGGSLDPSGNINAEDLIPALIPATVTDDGDIEGIIKFADDLKSKGWGFVVVPYRSHIAPEIRKKWAFD